MIAGRRLGMVVRATAVVVVARRLAGAARPAPPVEPVDAGVVASLPSISVVVPARNEEHRLGPCLQALRNAPGVAEVIVVDDHSTDTTAVVAAAHGARVVTAADLPDGWAGKAWALQQGLEAATGEWVVTLDADTRPDSRLPAAAVARAVADRADLMTVAGSFLCPTDGLAMLHPAMLTTLVMRYGPPGATRGGDRLLANGQCMVMPRAPFLADGGLAPVAHHMVEDVALARERAGCGRRVTFLDASALLQVQMYEDAADAWRGWGRSLALPGVEKPRRQWLDLTTVLVLQGLPLVRLMRGRVDVVDAITLMLRLGTLAGTAVAYRPRRGAYWLSPLADPVAVATLARSVMRPDQPWRGRHAPTMLPARTADRSGS